MTSTTKAGLAAIIGGLGAYIAIGLGQNLWLDATALLGLFTALSTGLGLLFSKSGSPSE